MTAPMVTRKGTFGQAALPWHPLPHMDDYLLNLEVNENSPSYIRTVKLGLAYFGEFAKDEGLVHPGEIKRAHLLRFQAFLIGKPISVRYRQQLLKYVRGWINWLEDTRLITESPWYNIKIGHTAKKPNPLEDEDLASLFAAHRQQAFSISPFMFHRREVILGLLYGWGLRIHELHALNVSNLDLRLEWVTVKNKGGGHKTLPYGESLKEVIQRWQRVRATHSKVGEDALLVDSEGKRLSIQMIRKIVTELGERAGVPVNPHRLRDTCGTHLLDGDVPIDHVMKILGHASVAQTRQYARVNDHKVKESHDAAMNGRLNDLLFKNTGDLP